jgi:hypothetical protein
LDTSRDGIELGTYSSQTTELQRVHLLQTVPHVPGSIYKTTSPPRVAPVAALRCHCRSRTPRCAVWAGSRPRVRLRAGAAETVQRRCSPPAGACDGRACPLRLGLNVVTQRALSITQRALSITQRAPLASPSELLASPSDSLASPSELLRHPASSSHPASS